MITDHQPLVEIFKNDADILSHRLQRILICMHHYNFRILTSQDYIYPQLIGYPGIIIM